MLWIRLWAGAVSVPAQVWHNQGKGIFEQGRYFVPGNVGLRVAVNQQQGRATAPMHQVDGGVAGVYLRVFKAFEHDCFSLAEIPFIK